MAKHTLQNDSIAANWQAAWGAYSLAKSEADKYESTVFNPACAKADAALAGMVLSIEERTKLEVAAVPGWEAINDKMEALNANVYCEAEWAVLLTPAPDRDALEWKIQRLFGDCGEFSNCIRMDGINAFLADVRRLLNH